MGQHPPTRRRNARVLLPFVARSRFSITIIIIIIVVIKSYYGVRYPVLFPVHLLRLHNGGKSTSVHGGDAGTHRRLGSSASATLPSVTAAAPQTGATDVMAVLVAIITTTVVEIPYRFGLIYSRHNPHISK